MTSGLVVLAKSKDAAATLSKEIRDKSTKKTYLARVKGKFPAKKDLFRILNLEEILNITIDDDEDDDEGKEMKDKKNNNNSNGKNNDNDDSNDIKKENTKDKQQEKQKQQQKQQQQQQQQQLGKKRDRNGSLKSTEINESDLPPRVRVIPTFEDVTASERVGIYDDDVLGTDPGSRDFILRCPIGTYCTCFSHIF